MTLEFVLRLAVAALLGGIIGAEREYHAKEAGVRTHLLVALGSALFTVLSMYAFVAFGGKYDAARVAAGVVTGVGFLGAGVIIFQKQMVRGLTTAAGLWVTASIGMACGAGMYILAVAATAIMMFCLILLGIIFHKYGDKRMTIAFTVNNPEEIKKVLRTVKDKGLDIVDWTLNKDKATKQYEANMVLNVKKNKYDNAVETILNEVEGVTIESVE